ncbi:hypothetical protein WICPIJ_009421 [Wickerhamomyces pijperi]|uniref:Amino acid permease/ SLC12A domain-containing protein n=1 Tax=Wickerhamomyces pijperi TaxID=599730 RepID=A0A9P8PMP9_WICPI|nr:hypothetical protein WICPIJ_009421 [Wickerhamomyces pijperi]
MSQLDSKHSEKEITICSNSDTETIPLTRWGKFLNSFKQAELEEYTTNGQLNDLEKAIAATAKSPLRSELKNRHLQMIAIGGAIGTGLFVGSGNALASGGPGALLIGWGIIGVMIYCTVQVMGELAVCFPVNGGFNVYTTRFVDTSLGFAMGWNYALLWLVSVPIELVAAAITIQYWNDTINGAVWVAIFFTLISLINLFGVRGYGEAEFVFSIVKVIAVVGFVILGVVIACGGGPHGGYIGAKYWHNPGAFSNGFKGVCSIFVSAAFSFSGTELVGLAAAETENPRKTLPKAAKQVFWRITLFYIVSLTVVGCIVPYNDPRLGTSSDASASPFVIAITNAGIGGLPTVMNIVILISVLSVGNSSVYASSRTLTSLACQGFAPRQLAYIDKAGRPIISIAVNLIFGLLSFLAAYKNQGTIFDWMYALCGLSTIFTWGSICLAHLRFRYAMKVQGRNAHDELTFTAYGGIYSSVFGLFVNGLVLVVQFYVALWPIGGTPNAYDFFETYLSAAVVIVCYVGHKLYSRNWKLYIRGKDVDLDTGRSETDLDLIKQQVAEEKEWLSAQPCELRNMSILERLPVGLLEMGHDRVWLINSSELQHGPVLVESHVSEVRDKFQRRIHGCVSATFGDVVDSGDVNPVELQIRTVVEHHLPVEVPVLHHQLLVRRDVVQFDSGRSIDLTGENRLRDQTVGCRSERQRGDLLARDGEVVMGVGVRDD